MRKPVNKEDVAAAVAALRAEDKKATSEAVKERINDMTGGEKEGSQPTITRLLAEVLNERYKEHANTWGRVFAVLNKATGKDMSPGVTNNVAGHPGLYLSQIMNQAIRSGISRSPLDRRLDEIMGQLPPEAPGERYSDEQQSSFWLGYYHERKKMNQEEEKAEPAAPKAAKTRQAHKTGG